MLSVFKLVSSKPGASMRRGELAQAIGDQDTDMMMASNRCHCKGK